MISPHRIGDDFTGKAKAFQARHLIRGIHPARIAHAERSNNLAIPASDLWSRPQSVAISRSSEAGCEHAHSPRSRRKSPSAAPSSIKCWHAHALKPSGA
jgi:hypothetical protein